MMCSSSDSLIHYLILLTALGETCAQHRIRMEREAEMTTHLDSSADSWNSFVCVLFANTSNWISGRKKLQVHLEPRSVVTEEMSNLINALSIPVCITNQENEILGKNTAFEEIYDPSSKSLLSILASKDEKSSLLTLLQSTGRVPVVNFNCKVNLKNGTAGNVSIKETSLSVLEMKGTDFLICSFLEVISSEHEEKVVEEIKQRGQALEAALSQVSNLENSLETKRIFVRYVGHEIRTPLNVVASGLQLLQPTEETEEAELLADIKSACLAAIDIVNDLLTYEKLDSNILTIDKKLCNMVEIVKSTVSMFQIQAKQKGVNLRVEILPPDLSAIVDGDPNKLAQVLRNLISNAVKFTPTQGSVHVGVDITESSYVRIKVQDSGAGMTVEERARLFNEIVQFNAASLQQGNGSGLGLYLTRRIVDLHGGSIGVDLDWTGPGSIFYLQLQACNEVQETTAPIPHKRGTVNARRESRRFTLTPSPSLEKLLHISSQKINEFNPKVLLVDDAVLCRKLHVKILKQFCGEIVEASDGKQAVDAVKESIRVNRPYDAIFMDSSMYPGMNGPEATREIRDLGYIGKIFGVTGYGSQNDIDDFLASGADQIFLKPVSAADFRQTLIDLDRKES